MDIFEKTCSASALAVGGPWSDWGEPTSHAALVIFGLEFKLAVHQGAQTFVLFP